MFITPMLPDSKEEPFSDPAYVFEPKFDGHRVILSVSSKETRLFTDGGKECTKQYPELLHVPLADEAVLDGEVYCIDPATGHSDYEGIMERLRMKSKKKTGFYASRKPARVAVWDILYYRGRDLRHLPLMKRRSILESVLPSDDYVHLVPQTEDEGEALFQSIVKQSSEGMVAKRKDSIYVPRASRDWLKIMNNRYAEVEITGYSKDDFGWLIQIEENGARRSAGIIKQAVSTTQQIALFALSKNKICFESDRYVYLQPGIKAKVKYRGYTRHGMLRAPGFINFV